MGIFWSMLPADGQRKGLQYFPKDVVNPCRFKLQLYDGFVKDDEFEKYNIKTTAPNKYPISEKTINRRFCAENVTREEISVGKVRGVLYKPKGPGPFKGIIDIYGGGGGLMEVKAPLFASHGFASMVLPLFRYKDLSDKVEDFNLDHVMAGVDYFASRDDILPGIGLAGLCLGGQVVMRLANENKRVNCVVHINGGYLTMPFKLNGECFMRYEDYTNCVFTKDMGVNESGGRVMHDTVKDVENIPERMLLKIENTTAKYLFIVGEDDATYPPRLDGRRFIERMEHYGKGDQVMCLSYPGAGHIIQPPYMPQTFTYYTRTFDMVHASGGQDVENAMACVHSWREILRFFQENTGINPHNSKL